MGIKYEVEPEASVVVTMAELRLWAADDEMPSAAVTGQMVVYSPMTLVTTTVWMAEEPNEDCRAEMAEVAVAAGQFVMEAAHEMTV